MFADKKKKKKDINIFVFSVFAIICFKSFSINAIKLPQDEVDALQQIATTLGSKYWKFDAESCTVEKVGLTETPPPSAEQVIECECSPTNETDCHVVKIAFKDHNLPGTLPPEITKLPKLREIDFALNYLNGTIPLEWFTTNLTIISLLVNRLSGEIPKELGNLTSLTFLNLESNAFSGTIPQELGNLVNLGTLMLSSNNLTGNLPASLSKLQNMTDFRINDLQLNGTIPSYIQNWKELQRLEIVASGLTGPIPSAISVLNNLKNLRISDIGGPVQPFPYLRNSTEISKLVLKNCNLAGQIPDYLSNFKNLETLDLSFNKLPGTIPSFAHAEKLRFLILAGNRLEGDVPTELLRDGITVDLSYNNLKWQSSESRSCRPNMNLNLNLFQSTSTKESSKVLPCIDDFKCPRYSSCLHVNCGGSDLTLKQNKTKILYQGDGEAEGGAAKYYLKRNDYWGFSSTGDYMDDNNFQNTRFTVFVPTSNLSDLYKSARIAPVSLTYFHACLENGKYTVNLDFAEIRFTNDETYNRLGRRVFDIYIQEKLVLKDFNIMDEAKGAQKPITKPFTVNVTNHFLAIRLSWAGKGTTRIPTRGVYGPLISAISIVSDSKPCASPGSGMSLGAKIAIGLGSICLIIFILGVLWFFGCLPKCWQQRKDPNEEELPSGTFTLRQIKFATDDFNPANKIGEGGFGAVFKGVLSDGRVVAVKQLSSKSRQGNREFLNEIGAISCLQHPNLVKLHGFCVERSQLLLVYEYMENNSLAQALFSPKHKQIPLDWPTRFKICCGIAKGLAFLHEESPLKFVHRDIKATNILLDKDLTPKISDFGLARLDEEEHTHVSTKVAGTIGYMAPEYALWGYLSFKADVYSYGVLVLEIVAGINNSSFMAAGDEVCLLEWAMECEDSGDLMQVVDERLRPEVDKKEAETLIKVALVCTSASASDRPIMSEVVGMLEGHYPVPEPTPGASRKSGDIRFKAFILKLNPCFNSLNTCTPCLYPPPLRLSPCYYSRRFCSPVTVNAAKKTSQIIRSELDDRINGSDSRFLDRQKALEAAMNDINGSFGKGSVTRLGSAGGALVETFPSGVLTLDLALGGGLPKGRIVEIYGPESSGKTTLALHAIAEVQKLGGNAMLVDAEHAFDPAYSKALGVDVENLIVCQPDNGEMALEIADRMCRSGAVDLICVDSVSALTPRAEIEGEIGMQQMGLQARLMSQALRKMSGNASKAGCTLIFLNQIRYKIGVYYGNPEVTSGGIALKFFASVRLEIRSAGKIKSSKGDEDIGLRARVRVQKSKVSRPYKQAEFEIMFGEGVSKLGCVLDCAEIMEVVVKKGSWYSYEDQRLGQGREKALQHLKENPSLQDEIEKRVRLLMLDGDVHRSTPLLSSSSNSVASHHEEEDDNSLDGFQ